MTWRLRDCSIIGSVCSLSSSAPFSRDAVVLANEEHPDARMILGREQADGSVDGEQMTNAEWRELLECEEALALAVPIPAASGAKCWLLHESFPEREVAAEELRAQAGAILYEEAREGVLIVVVDEQSAADLLERWSRDAFDHAWRLGQRFQWDHALAFADLAWLTDRSLALDRVALLALATEHARGASAAEDLIVFEVNSRPDRPERALRMLVANYRAQFIITLQAPLAIPMHEPKSLAGGVERWRSERSKTAQASEIDTPAEMTIEDVTAIARVLELKIQWMQDTITKQGAEIEELSRALDRTQEALRAHSDPPAATHDHED
jgi:hypothetical protein